MWRLWDPVVGSQWISRARFSAPRRFNLNTRQIEGPTRLRARPAECAAMFWCHTDGFGGGLPPCHARRARLQISKGCLRLAAHRENVGRNDEGHTECLSCSLPSRWRRATNELRPHPSAGKKGLCTGEHSGLDSLPAEFVRDGDLDFACFVHSFSDC